MLVDCWSYTEKLEAYGGRSQSLDGLLEEFLGLDTLDEGNIGTDRSSSLEAADSLVHTENLSRVRACDDDNVAPGDGITGLDRSADASDELLSRDNLLAEQMAAALGLDLRKCYSRNVFKFGCCGEARTWSSM